MRNFQNRAGLAIPTVLSVMVLMLIIIATVASQGIGALHAAGITHITKQSAYAAEAGVADGMRRLIENPDDETDFQEDFGERHRYVVDIVNNFDPAGVEVTAPNGAKVPPGYSYILATGSRRDGRYPRQAGVLVTGGVGSTVQFAIGAGGFVDMGGSKDVAGGIKANGNITLTGNTDIRPVDGNGRLLSSSHIGGGGNARMDSGQDARAQSGISLNLRGNPTLEPNDTTAATLPFINDYRTTNTLNAGEEGRIVLPNPDPALLLDPANYPGGVAQPWPGGASLPPGSFVDWSTYGSTSFSGTLDLGDGQVHYFPNGISFGGATSIIGTGTIIVDNGNSISIGGNHSMNANLIVLRDPADPSKIPSIDIGGNTTINGFVYSHQHIDIGGNADINGMVIAYAGNVVTGGNTTIIYDPGVILDLPGFGPWSAGVGGVTGGGAGPIAVVSWERF